MTNKHSFSRRLHIIQNTTISTRPSGQKPNLRRRTQQATVWEGRESNGASGLPKNQKRDVLLRRHDQRGSHLHLVRLDLHVLPLALGGHDRAGHRHRGAHAPAPGRGLETRCLLGDHHLGREKRGRFVRGVVFTPPIGVDRKK